MSAYDSHPSLSASLESISDPQSPRFHNTNMSLPSAHSGFRSDSGIRSGSERSLSPDGPHIPGWPYGGQAAGTDASRSPDLRPKFTSPVKSTTSGNPWYAHNPYVAARRNESHTRSVQSASPQRATGSRGMSDEDPTLLAARIPLPKGSSSSPERAESMPARTSYDRKTPQDGGNGVPRASSAEAYPAQRKIDGADGSANEGNFFRFSMNTEVQHRTDAFEAFTNGIRAMTQSRRSMATSLLMLFLAVFTFRLFTTTPAELPAPNVMNIARLAESFEPMMYLTETNREEIEKLSDTSVAVWDLGESVRVANLTSSSIIVAQLDELSKSLGTLSLELTKFYSFVNGDIDQILNTLEYAMHELAHLPARSTFPPSQFAANVHDILARTGVLANPTTGESTILGTAVSAIFGRTHAQQNREGLKNAFDQILNALEQCIQSELRVTNALFELFGSVDRQFLNLQRSTVREQDAQDRAQAEFLGKLWVRAVGGGRKRLNKFEKNKKLLVNVRERTIANKKAVDEHNKQLTLLQHSLEEVRRRLMTPLLNGTRNSHVSVAAQIEGIDAVWTHMRQTRDGQKQRFFETIWGKTAEMQRIGQDRQRSPEIESSSEK